MAVVGFEETVYRASEEIGMIDVCVVIESDADCPVTFPFAVELSTVAGSAGEIMTSTYVYNPEILSFFSKLQKNAVTILQ